MQDNIRDFMTPSINRVRRRRCGDDSDARVVDLAAAAVAVVGGVL
jgi:hypothetical protein